jgi:hypothetical protein
MDSTATRLDAHCLFPEHLITKITLNFLPLKAVPFYWFYPCSAHDSKLFLLFGQHLAFRIDNGWNSSIDLEGEVWNSGKSEADWGGGLWTSP